MTRARIALGGVGTKPWRSTEAEARLIGQPATEAAFRKAAEAALRDAKPQSQNGFKVELAKRCLVHALKLATNLPNEEVEHADTQETRQMSPIGASTPRVDGPLKVSGRRSTRPTSTFPGMLYAVPVEATIANGKIAKLDTAAAEKMPGVRAIFHRETSARSSARSQGQGFDGICDERRPPFEDDVVRYYGQYVALAVADTFETAKAAADAVRVTYAKEKPNVDTDLEAGRRARRWSTPRSARPTPAKRARRRRSRFRQRAGQARPDLRHAGRDAQPDRAARDDRGLGRSKLTLYETVAGGVQHARRARADVRLAERERPRHHQVRRLGFRQQALAVDALPARRRGGAAARQAGQARHQPQDDVPDRRPSRRAPSSACASAPRRTASSSRSSTTTSTTRSMLDDYHEDCGEATPFHYSVPNLRVTSAAPGATSARPPTCAARAPCPDFTRPSRR